MADWSNEPHVAATKLITILTKLQFSPRFSWNQANQHGRIQLACSVDSISAATEARKAQGIEDNPGADPSRSAPKGDNLLEAGKANQTNRASKALDSS